jgi:hypothetical protein
VAAYSGTPLFTISVQSDPNEGGTVRLDPQKSGYAKNNIVTVPASPATDMVFTGWGGALSGTQNPTTLRVSGNQIVIAHFATDSGGGGGGGGGGGTAPPPPHRRTADERPGRRLLRAMDDLPARLPA